MRLYVANSNVIELEDLTNNITGVHDAGAEVEVTLFDESGAEVAGETWPLTMAYDASDETYRIVLSDEIAITHNGEYSAVVRAVGSGSEVGRWELTLRAKDRKAC